MFGLCGWFWGWLMILCVCRFLRIGWLSWVIVMCLSMSVSFGVVLVYVLW